MLDLDTARRVILREYDALIEKLEACSEADWVRPVRCEGWTVRDLALHVHRYPHMMSEVLDRMKKGITEPKQRGEMTEPPRDELFRITREGRERLAATFDTLTPEDAGKMAPMPFATLPGFIALQIAAVEAGFHHNDLEWALGREVPLPDEIADAALSTLAGMLPMLAPGAKEQPQSPMAYTLSSPSTSVSMLYREGAWLLGEDASVPTCEISGDDSAVALLALGRIPAGHPSVKTTDPGAASRFKTYFPGP